ncbi:type IV pilus modification PilV family protein [Cerasicoccus arenae]|uniref:Prepilin-type N-terminal cleavage/methylation domain-containing protein n=1 Tax=Cerasicoccus arenae TaxID=424488 RepID=A0A8J3GE31_9BACT|nr:hypothetical protein [Cerasicoccus arenae]MBK1857223.1 hypothetical protein [Cerasicoccus arenae]GHC00100.1 hypothetical protein GCM10007047_15430 [Cerasicoccus arenae]
MKFCPNTSRAHTPGFSLFEVVLAVGVLSVSILALLGLFGPTMSSVRDVVDSNEANGVRTRLNTALMTDEIYDAYAGLSDPATRFGEFAATLTPPTANTPSLLFFWNERKDVNSPLIPTFKENLNDFDITLSEGSAFVVALEQGMQGGTSTYDFSDVSNQGHFPILVSIYAVPASDLENKSIEEFKTMVNTVDPLFIYTTAKLR